MHALVCVVHGMAMQRCPADTFLSKNLVCPACELHRKDALIKQSDIYFIVVYVTKLNMVWYAAECTIDTIRHYAMQAVKRIREYFSNHL